MKHHQVKYLFLRGVVCLLLCIVGITSAWGEEITVTFDASKQGYSNGQEITNITITEGITVTFAKGTNNCKYYNTGTAIRVYGGGYFTITSTIGNITKIKFTFGSDDGSNQISKNKGTYYSSTGTWTGSSESIKFSIDGASGHRKFKTFAITYEPNVPPLSSIDISGTPNRTTYFIGETPSAEGLIVTAKYLNDSVMNVTNNVKWTFEPATISRGDTEVTATATYQNITEQFTFDITTTEPVIYTLKPISGGTSGYDTAGATGIDINGTTWLVTGNSTILPWRIGGKDLQKTARDIKCSTPVYGTFGKVVVSIGNTSGSIELHSLTLSVADNPNFTNAKTYKHTSNLKANTEHIFDITPTTDGYYKITFNVSTSSSSNKYYEFSGAKFYKIQTTDLSSAGYATFCLPYNATIPDGLTAYTATDNGESVKLTAKEDGKIAAGEGVILKGAEGTYSFVATEGNVTATENNMMVGVTTDTELTASDNAYLLTRDKNTNDIAFRRLATTNPYTLGANKAYLRLQDESGSRQLVSVVWDDYTTSIDDIAEDKRNATNIIYNLAGQKLTRAQKGINIINGKLVIK